MELETAYVALPEQIHAYFQSNHSKRLFENGVSLFCRITDGG